MDETHLTVAKNSRAEYGAAAPWGDLTVNIEDFLNGSYAENQFDDPSGKRSRLTKLPAQVD
jgi:hypothetical protein